MLWKSHILQGEMLTSISRSIILSKLRFLHEEKLKQRRTLSNPLILNDQKHCENKIFKSYLKLYLSNIIKKIPKLSFQTLFLWENL